VALLAVFEASPWQATPETTLRLYVTDINGRPLILPRYHSPFRKDHIELDVLVGYIVRDLPRKAGVHDIIARCLFSGGLSGLCRTLLGGEIILYLLA